MFVLHDQRGDIEEVRLVLASTLLLQGLTYTSSHRPANYCKVMQRNSRDSIRSGRKGAPDRLHWP